MHRFFYWLTFGILAVLLFGHAAFAQTLIPITGHVGDPSSGVPAGISVKFELNNCGGNYPRVIGAFGIVRQNFTLTPNGSGLITGNIVPNDIIDCGGATGVTTYDVTLLLNGIPQQPAQCYTVLTSMGTFNLDVALPCTSSVPPTPGGPFDGLFNNLVVDGLLTGTSANFTGTVTANNFVATSITATGFHFGAAPSPCTTGFMTGLNADFSVICGTPASPPIISFNTRGDAVLPETGDYNCGQITGAICSLPTTFYQHINTGLTQRGILRLLSGTNSTVNCVDNPSNNSTDCTTTSLNTGGGTARTCNANGCYLILGDGTVFEWITGPTQSDISGVGAGNPSQVLPLPLNLTTTPIAVICSSLTPGETMGDDTHGSEQSPVTFNSTSITVQRYRIADHGSDPSAPICTIVGH